MIKVQHWKVHSGTVAVVPAIRPSGHNEGTTFTFNAACCLLHVSIEQPRHCTFLKTTSLSYA